MRDKLVAKDREKSDEAKIKFEENRDGLPKLCSEMEEKNNAFDAVEGNI